MRKTWSTKCESPGFVTSCGAMLIAEELVGAGLPAPRREAKLPHQGAFPSPQLGNEEQIQVVPLSRDPVRRAGCRLLTLRANALWSFASCSHTPPSTAGLKAFKDLGNRASILATVGLSGVHPAFASEWSSATPANGAMRTDWANALLGSHFRRQMAVSRDKTRARVYKQCANIATLRILQLPL